jgi:hypothetical protein
VSGDDDSDVWRKGVFRARAFAVMPWYWTRWRASGHAATRAQAPAATDASPAAAKAAAAAAAAGAPPTHQTQQQTVERRRVACSATVLERRSVFLKQAPESCPPERPQAQSLLTFPRLTQHRLRLLLLLLRRGAARASVSCAR